MAEAKPPPRNFPRPRATPGRRWAGCRPPAGRGRGWRRGERGSGPGGPSWTSGVSGSPGIWGSSCGAWGTTPRDSRATTCCCSWDSSSTAYLGHSAERFQSDFLLLFPGLVLCCLVTSPLLLVAVGVFVSAAIAVRLRAREAPLVLLGRELTPAHQLGVAGGVSLPLFWLAGAGAAVFWVLGAALVFLGSHAAFRQLEPPETPELQMEPV